MRKKIVYICVIVAEETEYTEATALFERVQQGLGEITNRWYQSVTSSSLARAQRAQVALLKRGLER